MYFEPKIKYWCRTFSYPNSWSTQFTNFLHLSFMFQVEIQLTCNSSRSSYFSLWGWCVLIFVFSKCFPIWFDSFFDGNHAILLYLALLVPSPPKKSLRLPGCHTITLDLVSLRKEVTFILKQCVDNTHVKYLVVAIHTYVCIHMLYHINTLRFIKYDVRRQDTLHIERRICCQIWILSSLVVIRLHPSHLRPFFHQMKNLSWSTILVQVLKHLPSTQFTPQSVVSIATNRSIYLSYDE